MVNRMRNQLANSTAIATTQPISIQARVTQVTVNAEIERALVEFSDDADLVEALDAVDDVTAKVTGKYAGDTWAATFRLMELVDDNKSYPALNGSVTKARVRKGIYGPVLRALGQHRVQRLARYEEAVRLEAAEAAKETESLDHSGE